MLPSTLHDFWHSFNHLCVCEETHLHDGSQKNVNSSATWVRGEGAVLLSEFSSGHLSVAQDGYLRLLG